VTNLDRKLRRLIGVVGNRKGIPEKVINEILDANIDPRVDTIVTGGAKGTDSVAMKFAMLNSIQCVYFLPDKYSVKAFVFSPPEREIEPPNIRKSEHLNEIVHVNEKQFMLDVTKCYQQGTTGTKQSLFLRNAEIAKLSDEIIAFIVLNRLRAGTWNTIRQYIDLGKKKLTIYNQYGTKWSDEEISHIHPWVLQKLKNVKPLSSF